MAARPSLRRDDAPRTCDCVPVNICPSCGLIGDHETPADCISTLRSWIADLTFQLEKARTAARGAAGQGVS
jgi:hypothetical protein